MSLQWGEGIGFRTVPTPALYSSRSASSHQWNIRISLIALGKNKNDRINIIWNICCWWQEQAHCSLVWSTLRVGCRWWASITVSLPGCGCYCPSNLLYFTGIHSIHAYHSYRSHALSILVYSLFDLLESVSLVKSIWSLVDRSSCFLIFFSLRFIMQIW